MKILILSTFGNFGGAAIAARRLELALKKHGVEVNMGVLFSSGSEHSFLLYQNSLFGRWKSRWLFIMERLKVFFVIRKRRYLYKYSIGRLGLDLCSHPAVSSADLIHLHWVHFSFLSMKGIPDLAKLKPLLWTLHDMWSFTGGCHYSMECRLYMTNCETCFYLKKGSKMSSHILEEKQDHWKNVDIQLVGCSEWLSSCARNSFLFKERDIKTIGNPIDTTIFRPSDKKRLRDQLQLDSRNLYVLVGAMDLSDERKGMNYLVEALKMVAKKIPNLHLLTFGKSEVAIEGVDLTAFGTISSEEKLAEIYNAADLFILPSVQDNLPNTVMESMACGTPVVAFDCGGVSDMVTHLKSGYLAENKNVDDLGKGILLSTEPVTRANWSKQGREHIVRHFSEDKIAKEYTELYRKTIDQYKGS